MRQKTPNQTAGLKIIAVLLAILLWLYVVNQGELSAGSNYTEVALQYYNLPGDLTVSGPQTVSVRLWGNFKQTGEITAYVELASLSQGEYNLPVKVKPVQGAMFTSVKPDKVKVHLQRIKENLVPVNYEVRQNPPAGYKLVDVIMEPSKCLVKGDQAAVNRVVQIIAPLDLGRVKDIASFKVTLAARDARGEPIAGVSLVPGAVSVYAVVEQPKEVSRVAVKPDISGKVADGYQMVGFKAIPETVSILGDNAIISKLTTIDTARLDVTDKKESFSQVVNVSAPAGVTIYPNQVTVAVDIIKLPEKEVP